MAGVPADRSSVHATARLHQGKDCAKAQVTSHFTSRDEEADRWLSPIICDIINLCMNDISYRNHTSNPAPPLSAQLLYSSL